MHDHFHGHPTPLLTSAIGFLAAALLDDAGRGVAILIGLSGLAISVVRLRWDWQDRRARRAAALAAAALAAESPDLPRIYP